MELKSYQKSVLSDLTRFLALFSSEPSIRAAYRRLWQEKGVRIGGIDGLPDYQMRLPNVPEVCFKVPTGGGKTFIAASSLKPIFDSMPPTRTKAVVWLVPSDAILSQTYKNLSDPKHDYRKKIDVDFGGRVEVYSKDQLLNGQNFNPTSVVEVLSLFVLSYDSFRTSKKDGRKAYQENGALAPFQQFTRDSSSLLPETDDTALIQVIRSLNPVVIVDESHHAKSGLSTDMLRNFNPSFVLDLTATPDEKANIISFVDASQLKKADMVKLPVIVYNRKNQQDVYADAISIRHKLEVQAKEEQKKSGRYIRPIVLFQAQPKNSADATTYEKIKAELVAVGIRAEEIAIKTADRDELKNVNLMSPDCPIRYIITVNALKEGWDCPFAYVLATVANRTSKVDVEQILGRVLRLPYAKKNESAILNLSYVITSSADFHATIDRVVEGLNNAGFSAHDYRAEEEEPEEEPRPAPEQIPVPPVPEEAEEEEKDLPPVDTESLKDRVSAIFNPPADETGNAQESPADLTSALLDEALAQNADYEAELEAADDSAVNQAPTEVRAKMNVFRMENSFAEEASAIRIPQFMLKINEFKVWGDSRYVLLEQESLTEGFTLRDKDVQIDFNTMEAEIARIDTDGSADGVPKAWRITGYDNEYFKKLLNEQPSESRLAACKKMIKNRIGLYDYLDDRELSGYIDRVVSTFDADRLNDFMQTPIPYVNRVKDKVDALVAVKREKNFEIWREQGRIVCRPNYTLPASISPTTFISVLPKSLYSAEEDMNDYERDVVEKLVSLDNIKWWHRNIARTGFRINGPINAYPDIIVLTHSGKILMIETKGDHLDNAESKAKAKLGHEWDNLAGPDYRYFMVFQTKSPDYPGAYSLERFMEIIKAL